MKITLCFIAILLFIVNSNAQSQTISANEYEKIFQFAVSKTNADYPLIFKVTTQFIKNGKTIRTNTVVNENESAGHYRIKRTVLADGKETSKYQITAGFGNVFCSDDGVDWKPSKYECSGSVAIYGPRQAESTEYSVAEKSVKGNKMKVYREYSVFATSEGSKKKEFQEKISTIDSRGFFVTIVDTEGTLDPIIVTLKGEQSWITQAKFKPVISPIK